jgi:hypothetical protein
MRDLYTLMINRIRMYLDASMNTDWITFAPEGTGMPMNAEMMSQM